MDSLMRAIDKRANDRITDYQSRVASIQVGVIKGTTLSGASVQLEGSGQYLSNVATLQGTELVIGARVLLARITRARWVIIGAVEVQGTKTQTVSNTVPVAAPQNLSADNLEIGEARLEWDASYFDVALYEVQIGTISDGDHSDTATYLVDNSQWEFVSSDGTYYARLRAVGPTWYRSSWTGWIQFQVTSAGTHLTLDHGALDGLADDDHTQYVLADGTRDLAFTPLVVTDWDGDTDPGDVDDAIDQLAERVDDLENAVVDAADVTFTAGTASDWTGSASDFDEVDEALDQLADRVTDLEQPHWHAWEILPEGVRLPGSNPPASDTLDGFSMLRFDRSTEESVYYIWKVPEDFYVSASSVRGHMELVVENPPSGSGDEVVVMGFEYKKIAEGDVFSFTSGTSSGTLSVTITDGESAYVIHDTPNGTPDTTGWAVDDIILFRFYRDATNVLDTYDNEAVGADNDAWVFAWNMQYLSSGPS